jgi:hypothetical protein
MRDSVDQDIRLLGDRNWKSLALNGEVEEAFEEGQCSRANDVQDEESFARLH